MKIRNLLLCTIFSLVLVACSKITQENFSKIKTHMTIAEVIQILGEPTTSENIAIGGISGTSATWKDKNAEIDIQFLNDKVTVKSYNRIADAPDND